MQEIEIDPAGETLFVLSSCWHNRNNWLLIYDTELSEPNATVVWLNHPVDGEPNLFGPSALVASAVDEKLYMVSSAQDPNDANDLATEIYCFAIAKSDGKAMGLTHDHTIAVTCPAPTSDICDRFPTLCREGRFHTTLTALAENADDGTLYATGFSGPAFQDEIDWPARAKPLFGTTLFTTPILAVVAPGQRVGRAVELTGTELVLPLSMAWNATEPKQ